MWHVRPAPTKAAPTQPCWPNCGCSGKQSSSTIQFHLFTTDPQPQRGFLHSLQDVLSGFPYFLFVSHNGVWTLAGVNAHRSLCIWLWLVHSGLFSYCLHSALSLEFLRWEMWDGHFASGPLAFWWRGKRFQWRCFIFAPFLFKANAQSGLYHMCRGKHGNHRRGQKAESTCWPVSWTPLIISLKQCIDTASSFIIDFIILGDNVVIIWDWIR